MPLQTTSQGFRAMRHPFRDRATLLGLLVLGGILCHGCAHRREAFYPNQRGVHVRAPFVNIDVPAGPRVHVGATGSYPPGPDRQARRLSEPPLLTEEDWDRSEN